MLRKSDFLNVKKKQKQEEFTMQEVFKLSPFKSDYYQKVVILQIIL